MGHRRFIRVLLDHFRASGVGRGGTLPYTCRVAALKQPSGGLPPGDQKAGGGGSGRIADGVAASLARGVTCAVPTRRVTLYADPCFAAGHRCIADPASSHALASSRL